MRCRSLGHRHAVSCERSPNRRSTRSRKHLVVEIRSARLAERRHRQSRCRARSNLQMSRATGHLFSGAQHDLLSFALRGQRCEGADIFIGSTARLLRLSGLPARLHRSVEHMASLAPGRRRGRMRPQVNTPLIAMTKAEIIKTGIQLGVDYSLTHSCYDPGVDGLACGRCDSCLLRLRGFADAGTRDPLRYKRL